MRVLVCGGRNFNDREFIYSALDAVHKKHKISLIIHGDCSGVDVKSGEWAVDRGVPFCAMPAHWTKKGHAAGPIRNRWMVDELFPNAVVAFPGNKGTADMVGYGREKGLKVWEVPYE